MQPNSSKYRSSKRGMNQVEAYAEMLVEELNIPNAIARRLCGRGITTVGQLLTMSVKDVQGYWIGKGSIEKIQNALMEIGFEPLGVNAPRQTIRRIV